MTVDELLNRRKVGINPDAFDQFAALVGGVPVEALLAAQIAAEDAVLAQGLEVWSVSDPATGEVVLHVMPKDSIAPKPNSEAGASKAIRLVGAIPTGAANTAA